MVTRPARLLFVTADMGAGHRQVTAELVRRCSAAGASTETLDIVRDAGPAGRRLKRTYQRLLTYAPWLYDAAMRFWARWPKPLEAFTALNARPFERLLAAAVERFEPDLVVSNYNLASQCLGRLLRAGRLRCPVATLVVDPGAHPYWVSADIPTHLVLTRLTGERLSRMGARGVRVVRPVLRPEFAAPPGRSDARTRLELPADRRIVLVTAGSWAVGGLPETLAALRAVPGVVVVVLCGRDDALRRRLTAGGQSGDVVPVGWTRDVVDYLAAADVVVDNAGGLTCWEALACRAQVVLFNPLAGHGRVNVATLDELGLATWARDASALRAAVGSDRPPAPPLPEPAEEADAVLMTLADPGR
jgi:UDP-N-acetylglucosamine:LPS N-acetylglucosamine transferase